MEWSTLIALALFAFASTFTPGPNNLMLMTSGANVGFRRTLPHILGITLGFAFMVWLVGMGLSGVFQRYPSAHDLLKYLSLGYLLYLAYHIATSNGPSQNTDYRPMSFFSAAAFQWVNPKGWSMALTAVTLYSDSGSVWQISAIAVVFMLSNLPCASFWTLAGVQMQKWLTKPERVQRFNWLMAALLVGSTVPML